MPAAARPLALRLTAALLVLASVLVYANTLDAPFVFDDAPALIENPSIRNLRDLGAVLSPPSTAGSAAGRPLINLSFALNYALGGLNPLGYHLVNVALHAAAALALFGLVRRTLLQAALRDRFAAAALPLAGAIALLWAVHPLLTESVTCAVQRTEVFGGLFYLLILYSFIRATEPGATPRRWAALAIAACFLGVATKEIVVTAPLAVLAYDCLFVAGSLRAAWSRRWRFYTALAASWLLLAWLMSTSAQRGGVVGFDHGVSSWEYLLTQCRALTLYLKLCVWPHPLVLDYGVAVVRSLPAVLPQALLLVALALATVWGLWKKHPAAFAGAWFFLILAPSSSVVPLVSQPIAEHRMYLPLVAVIVLIVLIAHRLLGRASLWLFVALAVLLGFVTVRRNAVYHSAISILSDTVAQQPDNARAHSLLGLAYEKAGRPADAVASARAAAHLDPGSAAMHYNLGRALLQTAQPAAAATAFTTALRLRPDYAEAHCNLSVALLALDRPADAFTHLEAALRAQPDYADAHFNLGNLLARQRRLADAITHYEAALRLEPTRADAHFNLGKALLLTRRPAEAAAHFETVLRLTPNDPDAARALTLARQLTSAP